MKPRHNSEEQRPPLLLLLALLLIVAFVATTPMAFSKYAAKGTGEATARLAAWSNSKTDLSSVGTTPTIYLIKYTTTASSTDASPVAGSPAHQSGSTTDLTFTVNINSEVMTDLQVKLAYILGAQTTLDFDPDTQVDGFTDESPVTVDETTGTGTKHTNKNNYTWRHAIGLQTGITFTIGRRAPSAPYSAESLEPTYHAYVTAVQVD